MHARESLANCYQQCQNFILLTLLILFMQPNRFSYLHPKLNKQTHVFCAALKLECLCCLPIIVLSKFLVDYQNVITLLSGEVVVSTDRFMAAGHEEYMSYNTLKQSRKAMNMTPEKIGSQNLSISTVKSSTFYNNFQIKFDFPSFS